MAWFGLLSLLALVVLAGLAARVFLRASPHDLAQAAKAFAATFTALLGSGLIYAGRFGFAIAALGATAYAIRAFKKGQRPPDPFETAEDSGAGHDDDPSVTTATLAMRLDPATGALDGEVRQGHLRGRRLSALPLAQLLGLLTEVRRDDPESEPLLEAFLDRRHPGWRTDAGGDEAGAGDDGAMTERRALEILGLAPGADEQMIKAAHRRLMAQVHPDRGGSAWLAAQLNAAREYLLARGGRR
ncbi:MAG: DnaJ domain-containing protein [Alphaproteobacteria bacterium]